jgi:hypothetical protein
MRSYFKETYHKKSTGGVPQSVGPEFKPQCCNIYIYIWKGEREEGGKKGKKEGKSPQI